MKEFIVFETEEPETEKKISAYTASLAAEQYVLEYEAWHSEYPVGRGETEANITVRQTDGTELKFRVTGQPVPEYTAEQVSERELRWTNK